MFVKAEVWLTNAARRIRQLDKGLIDQRVPLVDATASKSTNTDHAGWFTRYQLLGAG